MARVKKNKLKKSIKIGIVLVILIVVAISIPFGIRFYKENKLRTLKYSDKAITSILKYKKDAYIEKVGYLDTLNFAFESPDFKVENLEHYQNIAYNSQPDLIKNINILIEKDYSDKEISLLVKQSTNESLTEFAKRDAVDDVQDYFVYDYSKLEYYDRYVAYQIKEREDEETTVTYVNIGLDKPFYENPVIINEYSETMLANKYRQLSEDYEPDVVKIDQEYCVDDEKQYATEVVKNAFQTMADDASKENLHILVNSSYRSYKEQQEIYDLYKKDYGETYAENTAARPGFSEHQTGLVIDIAAKGYNVFKDSKEYTWVKDNCYKYGFVLRYPAGKQNITGYRNEPWHYRYVGVEIATYIHEHNITFDEYFVQFLDK